MNNEEWLSAKQLQARGLGSCRTIWRRAKDKKNTFPSPIKFSKSMSRWRLSEILKYETSIQEEEI